MVFPVMYNLIIVVCRFGAMGRALSRDQDKEWGPGRGLTLAWGCCGGGANARAQV